MAREVSTEFIDSSGISSLVACRLIALDKNPGARPIGACETIRRIISKAILSVVKNILTVAGALQFCAGQDASCDAVVHSMHTIFDDPKMEALLLVYATNASNNLNRDVAFRNISMNCSAIFLTIGVGSLVRLGGGKSTIGYCILDIVILL